MNIPSWRNSSVGLGCSNNGSPQKCPKQLNLLQEFSLKPGFQNTAKLAKVTELSYFQRTRSLFQLSLWLPFRSFKLGVVNYGPQITTICTVPVFINKVSLEHSHTHSFMIVHGCFCAIKTAEHQNKCALNLVRLANMLEWSLLQVTNSRVS